MHDYLELPNYRVRLSGSLKPLTISLTVLPPPPFRLPPIILPRINTDHRFWWLEAWTTCKTSINLEKHQYSSLYFTDPRIVHPRD